MCLGVSNFWRTEKIVSHYDTSLYEHDVSVYRIRKYIYDRDYNSS
jgi:hypothetical protein